MDKNFDFKKAEEEINAKWINGNMFEANVNKDKKPYTIVMPPPNITSRLHIGHAYDMSIQDFIIRFKRMQGFEALLLPGADHAAIATEVKVVEQLREQGIEKSSLTREQFLEHIDVWYKKYTQEIKEQMKRLGISCDWNRFAFTMDARTTRAVKEVFKNLHKKGLIYRGERMINWCPKCKTALSDAEVTHTQNNGFLWEIKYPLADGSTSVTVATTRPETMFGDVAVAVNPNDARYKDLVGKAVKLPLTKREIPIIADELVDIKFGTGALKITPAHDTTDFEIGMRHKLEIINCIDEDGKLTAVCGSDFAGTDRIEARTKVVSRLKEQGLLKAAKPYKNNVGRCYRCNQAVEPALSKQWFVAMKKLAEPCITGLNNGLTIVPKKYEKIYLHWLNNIKDWCISRQLLSGHRVPVEGETDVLDTWFSSALWPFCTLGWPEKTPEFEYFYPTQTLVTAYDILFFWVIRMVFSGLEHTGKMPFSTVLFHGLVRDMSGRKMSKSLGNGVDPVQIIEDFGTDVLRFSLIAGTKLDRDPRYSITKATVARNFINKIWNATKFYLAFAEDGTNHEFAKNKLSVIDKWILTKLNGIIKSTTRKYEKFDFGVAANDLQAFFWNDFCDWYVEACKVSEDRKTTAAVFSFVLKTFMKLINPIMPFVTEHIYCNELKSGESLLHTQFPQEDKTLNFPKEKKLFEKIKELTAALRAAKKQNPETQSAVIEPVGFDEKFKTLIERFSGLAVTFGKADKGDIVLPAAKIRLQLNLAAAAQKIEQQKQALEKEIARGENLLSNKGFTDKAPASLVETEKRKLQENKNLLEQLMKH